MSQPPSSQATGASFAGDATLALSSFGEAQLRLLRTFSVVVAAGGFSSAAAELQVDLSTISKQFRELERWLGLTLARRGRSGFQLTEEGERLHALARQLFGAMRNFSADVATLSERNPPVLRLGVVDALLSATPSPGGCHVAKALARCVQALPGLQCHLSSLRPLEIERQILAGTLDAGIIAAHPGTCGLEQHRLYSEANSLYVAPGHPWHAQPGRELSASELGHLALVTDPYWATVPHPLLAPALNQGRHTRADSLEAVALLVLSGHFAGFLPDHLVQGMSALAGLRAVQPERFAYQQDIVLTCRTGKVSASVRKLLRSLNAV